MAFKLKWHFFPRLSNHLLKIKIILLSCNFGSLFTISHKFNQFFNVSTLFCSLWRYISNIVSNFPITYCLFPWMMIYVGMNHFHDIYLDIPNHQHMQKNSKCEPITLSSTQQKNSTIQRTLDLNEIWFVKAFPKSFERFSTFKKFTKIMGVPPLHSPRISNHMVHVPFLTHFPCLAPTLARSPSLGEVCDNHLITTIQHKIHTLFFGHSHFVI